MSEVRKTRGSRRTPATQAVTRLTGSWTIQNMKDVVRSANTTQSSESGREFPRSPPWIDLT
jgi:hypothetical protein